MMAFAYSCREAPRALLGLTSPYDERININRSHISFTTNALLRDLGFNPGIGLRI